MTDLNARIRDIPMPRRMQSLPVSDTGFPIPWFVGWIKDGREVARGKGTPDFRFAGGGRLHLAAARRLCWICGEPLGKLQAFVIGPMCAINRISSDPASHADCAEYAVKACPFLAQPNMRRNKKDWPEETSVAEGMIERNPGVTVVWVTKAFEVIRVNPGHLFRLGEPVRCSWWREGRTATRAEIMHSIETGMPLLRKAAADQGVAHQLPADIARAMKLVPA